MEAVNQKDVNRAFLKFLAVFSVTVGLIIAAIFFDAFIPRKELTALKTKEQEFEAEKDYQESIKGKLREINVYLNSLESANNDGYNFDYLIGLKIAEMSQSVEYRKKELLEKNIADAVQLTKDTSRLGVYTEMVQSLRILHKSQLENVSFKRMVKPMQDYKQANDKYQQEYDRLQSELTKCQGLVLDAYKNTAKP